MLKFEAYHRARGSAVEASLTVSTLTAIFRAMNVSSGESQVEQTAGVGIRVWIWCQGASLQFAEREGIADHEVTLHINSEFLHHCKGMRYDRPYHLIQSLVCMDERDQEDMLTAPTTYSTPDS